MDLSGFNIFIIAIVLLLSAIFILYKRIASIAVVFINILFPLAIITILLTLFYPQGFTYIVENNFKETPLAYNLKSIDSTLTEVSKIQNSIGNSINNILNPNQSNAIEEYNSNIYQQVLNLLTTLLRIFLLVLSLLLLIFAVYIRYAFSGIFETRDLQKQINQLKEEVKILKASSLKN